MKKRLLALSVLGIFAGAASAQNSITIYGIVDAGISHESGGAAGSVTKLSPGIQSGNRLGFKGSEDLGGGLSAIFALENGFNVDTGTMGQGGRLFGRQAFVGLNGGAGAVTLGRQYQPLFVALDSIDPFETGLAGASTNLFAFYGAPAGGDVRINNSIKYSAPKNLGGFSADIVYGFGEVPGDTSAQREIGASVGYANGPIAAVLAYDKLNNAATVGGGNKTAFLGGTYNFTVAKAHLGFAWNKGDTNAGTTADNRDFLVGVSVPFGAGTVLASYIRKNDKLAASRDSNQLALGYTYALSKRTNFYTSYARIDNSNGAGYTVGNATEAGTGDKAYNLGIRHIF